MMLLSASLPAAAGGRVSGWRHPGATDFRLCSQAALNTEAQPKVCATGCGSTVA
jgi:hypothetical protein